MSEAQLPAHGPGTAAVTPNEDASLQSRVKLPAAERGLRVFRILTFRVKDLYSASRLNV